MGLNEETIKTWLDAGRLLGMFAVAFASICYAMGFMVVNMRLASYGVIWTSFLRTEYILVGAIFIFLLVMVAGWMRISRCFWRAGIEDIRKGKWISGAFGLILVVTAGPAALGGGLMLLSGMSMDVWSWKPWAIIGILVMCNKQLDEIVGALRIFGERANTNQQNGKTERSRPGALWNLTWPIFMFMLALGLYSFLGYASINPAFGGGYRGRAALSPTIEGKKVCREMKMKFSRDSLTVGPIEIIADLQDELVVKVSNRADYASNVRALRIRKSLINAIIPLNLEKDGKWRMKESDTLRIQCVQ